MRNLLLLFIALTWTAVRGFGVSLLAASQPKIDNLKNQYHNNIYKSNYKSTGYDNFKPRYRVDQYNNIDRTKDYKMRQPPNRTTFRKVHPGYQRQRNRFNYRRQRYYRNRASQGYPSYYRNTIAAKHKAEDGVPQPVIRPAKQAWKNEYQYPSNNQQNRVCAQLHCESIRCCEGICIRFFDSEVCVAMPPKNER